MSSLMFGVMQTTQPPHKMMERMRWRCVCCVAIGAPLPQFVLSARRIIVRIVLTVAVVAITPFIRDMKCHLCRCGVHNFHPMQYSVPGRCVVHSAVLGGPSLGEGKIGVKVRIVNVKVARGEHTRANIPFLEEGAKRRFLPVSRSTIERLASIWPEMWTHCVLPHHLFASKVTPNVAQNLTSP